MFAHSRVKVSADYCRCSSGIGRTRPALRVRGALVLSHRTTTRPAARSVREIELLAGRHSFQH